MMPTGIASTSATAAVPCATSHRSIGRRGYIMAMVLAGLASPAFAQLDLTSWTLVDPYNRWAKSHPTPTSCRMDETASSSVVGPGWIVSPFVLPATATFEITVQATGNGDDDFIGIAFSWQSSSQHMLLDWKKGTQSFDWGDPVLINDDSAEAGMKVKKINGAFTRDGLWGGSDGLGVTTTAGPLAPGWSDNAIYRFEVSITPGRAVIRRGGTQIFDITDAGITAGRIGFYAFSQDNVLFSDVHASAPSTACSPADVAPPGGDGTVDGSDFIAFINSFAIGDASVDPVADITGGGPTGEQPDGTIDGSDFIAFINAFAIGC